mmetsp:Transcript_10499/g.29509  ORF Transcript_10499/g.29509 Transcript_10499/m.29509 type:complete len:257 (+) Transcript_10499:751-1521(+)
MRRRGWVQEGVDSSDATTWSWLVDRVRTSRPMGFGFIPVPRAVTRGYGSTSQRRSAVSVQPVGCGTSSEGAVRLDSSFPSAVEPIHLPPPPLLGPCVIWSPRRPETTLRAKLPRNVAESAVWMGTTHHPCGYRRTRRTWQAAFSTRPLWERPTHRRRRCLERSDSARRLDRTICPSKLISWLTPSSRSSSSRRGRCRNFPLAAGPFRKIWLCKTFRPVFGWSRPISLRSSCRGSVVGMASSSYWAVPTSTKVCEGT